MKLYKYPSNDELEVILRRQEIESIDLDSLIAEVFDNVKKDGDDALSTLTLKYDAISLSSLEVSKEEMIEAETAVSLELKQAINLVAVNIEKFHAIQKETVVEVETMEGVICWRKSVGIEKVGLYIPGGTAPLFSTVLMLGIPAKIAGCKEVILCTPPDKNGKVNTAILYAANLVGITKIFKVGGAQAIAAMTYGTESVQKVYKIFGPGNQYVMAAKQYAQRLNVSIDMPAGPSEVMVVCDEFSNAEFIAADLLSQAEHGVDSQVILVSMHEAKIEEVQAQISKQLVNLSRGNIAKSALVNSIAILTNKESIPVIINKYAPEHLILNTSVDTEIIPSIVNAGSVFIGQYTPESAGDYASGTNHTLPTNGFAKQYSGVSVDSFVKKITFQKISEIGIINIGKTVQIMAEAEGLDAHKNAITVRLNALKK
jgi:histidinol dehydrogenase